MDLSRMKFLVAGAGLSGIGAAGLLAQAKASCILFDQNAALDIGSLREKLGEGAADTKIILGELPEAVLEDIDIAVLSPGIPTDAAFVKKITDHGVKLWGEVELAYCFSRGIVLAITGTNGKTTTTSLVGEIMREVFKEVFVVGNIGLPYTSVSLNTSVESVTVAEISSFQLETVEHFKPKVSAILNITPDHLDRHHTFEEYVLAKERITLNQNENDTCVLNYDNEITRAIGGRIRAKPFYFSATSRLEEGVCLEGEEIVLREGGGRLLVCNVNDLQILGIHNYENVMAAVAMAHCAGVPMEQIRKAVLAFQGVAHRIEYVGTKKGARYYNDSKGTNPDAAIKAIQAMRGPTLLIGGGYDKESDYTSWIQSFGGKVKWLVLLGQTREKIASCAREQGFTDILMAEDLAEAVALCEARAQAGDNVLLSPACASWGMFRNYEERGDLFKELVHNIKE